MLKAACSISLSARSAYTHRRFFPQNNTHPRFTAFVSSKGKKKKAGTPTDNEYGSL